MKETELVPGEEVEVELHMKLMPECFEQPVVQAIRE